MITVNSKLDIACIHVLIYSCGHQNEWLLYRLEYLRIFDLIGSEFGSNFFKAVSMPKLRELALKFNRQHPPSEVTLRKPWSSCISFSLELLKWRLKSHNLVLVSSHGHRISEQSWSARQFERQRMKFTWLAELCNHHSVHLPAQVDLRSFGYNDIKGCSHCRPSISHDCLIHNHFELDACLYTHLCIGSFVAWVHHSQWCGAGDTYW